MIFIFFGDSCSLTQKKDYGVEITIEYGNSYKIDIKNKKYTVFYMDKKPIEMQIVLSEKEEKMIIENYYENNLISVSLKYL